MDPTTRADWGKRVRTRRGPISQAQLAELAGVDQGTISRLERGSLKISDDLKWRIAGALGLPVDALFPWPAVLPPRPQTQKAAAAPQRVA